MKKRFIYTRISMGKPDNRDEPSEIDRLVGRARPADYFGKATIDLDEVFALSEYYPALDDPDLDLENILDGELGPDPETCNVHFKNGLTWGVQIPYEEMKELLRQYREGEDTPPSQDVGYAVATLARALDEDRVEGSLYYGYQSNIATAFYDEIQKLWPTMGLNEKLKLYESANQAAKNFLENLISSVK